MMPGQPVRTREGNMVLFDKAQGTIEARKKRTVQIYVECIKEESIEEYFEIMIQHGSSLFF